MNKNYKKNQKGFTLIELMIVAVIVGILISIAYPSYRTYILRSHRTDAIAALTQDQTILERCYAQNFTYSGTCAGLPTFPHNSSQNYYRISLSNVSASTFTLTATPLGTQALDTTCAAIAVDQANQKTSSDTSGTSQAGCWSL